MGKKIITLRVVFDTNVVLSALIFATGQLAWLRQSWRKGMVVPLLAETTVRELLTVLAFPKFHLTSDEIEALLADYLPFGHSIHPLFDQPDAPRCRDPHDQMFVDLALAGHADYLVTGDKDLLALSGLLSCQVMTPTVFREMMEERRERS